MKNASAAERYRDLTAELLTKRGATQHGLTDEQEARYATELDDLWKLMTPAEREAEEQELRDLNESIEREREANARFESCPRCTELRVAEDWQRADMCHLCRGKGFVRKPSSYACNRCGGSMCLEDLSRDRTPYGLVEQRVSGHYESTHLSDTTTYTFSLCEQCLRELFDTFKVPPQISHYMGGGKTTYAEDVDWHRFTIWRDAGGQKEKLRTGYCTYREHCQTAAVWRHFVSGHMTDEQTCDKHKIEYGNSHNVPVQAVAGVHPDPQQRSMSERRQVASALLNVIVTEKKRPTYLRFVGDAVLAMFPDSEVHSAEARHHGWSGLFVPGAVPGSGVCAKPEVETARAVEINGGMLYIQPNGGFDSLLEAMSPKDVARPEHW